MEFFNAFKGARTVLVLCLTLITTGAHSHGVMVEPVSRSNESIRDDTKYWPVAGIKARLRREPCIGLTPNRIYTQIKPGPMSLKLLFPDGANHQGYCTASLFDPLHPDRKVTIAETTNCARSTHPGAGKKGENVTGSMPVVIPQAVPCNPDHCVIRWEWTATHISRTNPKKFEHYDSCADVSILGAVESEITALPAVAVTAAPEAATGKGELFDQDWTLNLAKSFLHLQSVKENSIFETHGFEHMEGKITRDGQARVVLDLASLSTGIDIRNVRMQLLFFKTFQFPDAVITAELDKSRLAELNNATSISYPLSLTLDLHGVKKQIETDVVLTRVADKSVSIAVTKPILIPAEDFGLLPGVALLEDAAGVDIAPVASITFHLVFEGDEINPDIEIIEAEYEQRRNEELSAPITSTECANRVSVMSDAQSIYFASGSARIDDGSDYALRQIADFAGRCPDIPINIAGHTDNVGSAASNLALSRLRAESVLAALVEQGVNGDRLTAAGFGAQSPVAPNDTAENRARNRRIVFSITQVDPADEAGQPIPD